MEKMLGSFMEKIKRSSCMQNKFNFLIQLACKTDLC